MAGHGDGATIRIPVAIRLLPLAAGCAAVAVGLTISVGLVAGSAALTDLDLGGSAMRLGTAAAIAFVGGWTTT
jgi:hypothetical protein